MKSLNARIGTAAYVAGLTPVTLQFVAARDAPRRLTGAAGTVTPTRG
jgi:hypothetical protein